MKYGYRLFDTASRYENEYCVGQVYEKSVMKREEYSVVSTSPRSSWFERTKKNRESVEKLDIGAIDLHLMHCPKPGKILETWKAMIE